MSESPLDIRAMFAFLRELERNNRRDWFAQHRADYDTRIKPDFEEFVTGLLFAATKLDERFAYVEPRNCIFRIHRDVRFANDKSPYKPYLSAFLSPYGWRGSTPGYYIGLEPGGRSVIAAGIYTPEKPVLTDLRERIAQGDARLEHILGSKRIQPYLPLVTDPLIRMPRGFDRAHPRGELLRARRYMLKRSFGDAELTRADAFGLMRGAMRDTAPFVAWLNISLANTA